MGLMGTFCFVTLTLRNPLMEIEKLLGYVAQVVLANVRLGFGGPSSILQGGGAKNANLGNIFDKVRDWQFTIPQIGRKWKIKKYNCQPLTI